MRYHSADALRPPGSDYFQRARVALAARLAARHGEALQSIDAADLAALDPEFAAVWRRGLGETDAEELFRRALEMDTVSP